MKYQHYIPFARRRSKLKASESLAFPKRKHYPNQQRSIVSVAQTIAMAGIALFAISLILFVLVSTQIEQTQRAETMRTAHVTLQKDITRREVERVVASIYERRANAHQEAMARAKERTYQAHAMAAKINQTYQARKSPEEILDIILSVLGAVRFDGGHGYYFVDTLDGDILLVADRPDIQGRHYSTLESMEEQQAIARVVDVATQQQEGFLEYEWTMPGEQESRYHKISYVKVFSPYDLIIGSGLYLEDVEAESQQELLEEIAKIKYGDNGYFFVDNLDGIIIAHGDQPELVGTSLWDYTDTRGTKVFQELLEAQKNPKGEFPYYWWRKPETGEERPKIAFAMIIPEWEWLVGTGLYLDDVETDVKAMLLQLRRQSLWEVSLILIVTLITMGLVYILMDFLFRALRKDIHFFNICFAAAAKQNVFIDETKIKFAEFITIAQNANDMLREKVQILQTLKHEKQQLKNVNQELARSNKDLEQFAYVTSHDLQEPLRMVSSYTQLLERRYKDQLDQDANDFIAFAVDGATRMQHLIQDLLSYSRVTTRAKEMCDFDAHEALGEAIANLKCAINETSAMVSSDDLPTIHADRSQLTRVFQNLIGNAIKFRQPETSPHIHISARQEDNQWLFSVQDDGIGIDEQHQDRIFVIFQRLLSKEEYAGTGIGLAICKRIIERHGGKIWVQSVLGEGSIFYFTVPMVKQSEHAS
jgi:signal transduction histidine kinase